MTSSSFNHFQVPGPWRQQSTPLSCPTAVTGLRYRHSQPCCALSACCQQSRSCQNGSRRDFQSSDELQVRESKKDLMCESAHELGDKKLRIPATMHKLVLPENMSALSQNNEVRTGEPALERGRTGAHRGLKTEPETHCTYNALNSLTGPAWSPSLILGRRPECAYPPANMDHSNLFTQRLSGPDTKSCAS